MLFNVAGLGTLFQVSALSANFLEDCANFTTEERGLYSTMPTTLSVIQAASQSTFINAQLYSVVSGNDKKETDKIIKQTQTRINSKKYVNSSVNSEGHIKKTRRDPY